MSNFVMKINAWFFKKTLFNSKNLKLKIKSKTKFQN